MHEARLYKDPDYVFNPHRMEFRRVAQAFLPVAFGNTGYWGTAARKGRPTGIQLPSYSEADAK